MAQQPRGRPPSQAPPPSLDRGRNALTALGGGVLVLAVAGGAWALFRGKDDPDSTTASSPTATSTAAPAVVGPVVPGLKPKPTVSATSTAPVSGPVAAPAATKTASSAPTVKPTAAVATPKASVVKAPTKAPTAAPAVKPAAKPPVTAPQQAGTVAAKPYTFRVARGDTLWDLATKALATTGRSTSTASVASFVTKLYASNKAVVGSDPDLILPGQTIVWPAGL